MPAWAGAGSSLAELERHVRVRVERVGEGDTVVAVRDIPIRYENRRQLLPGQYLLQVSEHARVRQRQRVAPGLVPFRNAIREGLDAMMVGGCAMANASKFSADDAILNY